MKQKRNSEVTRERILTSAETLFAKKGYYGTKTRQIAKNAEISIQTLHYHFNDKLSLYHAVQKRAFQPFKDIVNRYLEEMLASKNVDNRVLTHFHRKIADEMFDVYNAFPNYSLLVFRQWLQQDGELTGAEEEEGVQNFIKWSEIVKQLTDTEKGKNRNRIDLRLVMLFITLIYAGLHINPNFISKLIGTNKNSKEYTLFLKTQIRLATRLLLGMDADC